MESIDYKNYCLAVMPFEKAFQDWNIEDRVRAIVTDNAANMSVAIREIQET